jgi:hypothetical protein
MNKIGAMSALFYLRKGATLEAASDDNKQTQSSQSRIELQDIF